MAKAKTKGQRKIENLMDAEKPNRLRSTTSLSSKMEKAASEREIKKISKKGGSREERQSASSLLSNLANLTGTLVDHAAKFNREAARVAMDVTKGSLKTITEAGVQFSQQIAQDVNWNKQAIVAQALSRATPLFGYFAAKFMETDVFKNAAENIKKHIGGAFRAVGEKFGTVFAAGFDKVRGLFGGQKSANNIKKNFRIPSMAVGGYVAKEGLINVHPAEVVMPIDKVMKLISDRTGGGDSGPQMSSILERLTSMNRDYIDIYQNDKKDNRFFMRTFMDALTTQNEDMLVEIKRSLAGNLTIVKSVHMAWQKTLELHPGFRATMIAGEFLYKMTVSPFKFLFTKRGSIYKTDLPKDVQPIANQTKTLHLIYLGMMWQFDNVKKHLSGMYTSIRDIASKITGNTYPDELKNAKRNKSRRIVDAAKLVAKYSKAQAWKDKMRSMIGAGPIEDLINKMYGGKENMWTKKRSFRDVKSGFKKFLNFKPPSIKLWWKRFRAGKSYRGENAYQEATVDSVFYQEAQTEAANRSVRLLSDISGTLAEESRARRKNNIFSMLFGVLGSLKDSVLSVMGGFKDMLSGGVKSLMAGGLPLLVKSAFGAIFALPMAWAGGKAVGDMIYEKLIKPGQDKLFEKLEKQNEAITVASNKALDYVRDQARGGDRDTRSKAVRQINIASDFDLNERKDSYGMHTDKFWRGSADIAKYINDARKEYILENIGLYDQYDPKEISRLRAEFYNSGGYSRGFDVSMKDPQVYGRKYEERFAKYLAEKGKPTPYSLVDERMEERKERYKQEALEAANKARDASMEAYGKVSGKVTETSEAVRNYDYKKAWVGAYESGEILAEKVTGAFNEGVEKLIEVIGPDRMNSLKGARDGVQIAATNIVSPVGPPIPVHMQSPARQMVGKTTDWLNLQIGNLQ